MRVKVLNFIVLTFTAYFAWLGSFVLESLYHGLPSEEAMRERNRQKGNEPPFPGAENDNIIWFLQISDIHLSHYRKNNVSGAFRYFCSETLDTIRPSVVMATGDITHAKYADSRSSKQFQIEWDWYKEILNECSVREKVVWLDIRGNHDNFDVVYHDHDSNIFRDFSVTGEAHGSQSYLYTHNTSFGGYSFVGMDACPNPGPRRPYNFFGVLHDEDLQVLSRLSTLAEQRSNATVWFSHYPSSIITTHRHGDLRALMASSVAHVCGHLHTAADMVYKMYGIHPSGHLEMELVDFTGNRRYRLMAFDHDLFSFTDTTLTQWPLVLITNPKDTHFSLPSREPLGRMAHSTHIRFLAFSTSPIIEVEVWVDGKPLGMPSRQGAGPLYTLPWLPDKYSTGLHKIVVTVKDSRGRDARVEQVFSLDGTLASLDLFPQMLLLPDLRALARVGFLFLWMMVVVSLLLAWCNHGHPSQVYPIVKDKLTFFTLLCFEIYFGIGPWYVAEVLTGSYGFIGAHGVYVSGHFLPGSMTYLYGTLQMVLFHIPLIFYLNYIKSHDRHVMGLKGKLFNGGCHVIMFLLLLLQASWAMAIFPYGWVAIVVSPGVVWTVPMALALVWRARTHKIRN